VRLVAAIALLVCSTAVAAADDMGGVVLDAKTGLGIPGALIASDDASAESAPDGSFVLQGVHARRVAVFVFAEGYAPAETELVATIPGRIEMKPATDAVEIIEVSGKAPDDAAPTAYTFSRDQIRALPGTGNDVLRALQSMPGVSRMPFGLGGLVLRGASSNESDVYIDGIEVPLAYHFGGVTSFYPSTLLDEVVLSPGGADVNYGRGVGGVADLRSREGRTDRRRIGGEIGVFDASVYGESELAGGGVTLGLRRSYADAFIGALLPPDRWVLPRYYDGQARWDRRLGGGTLTALGLFSDDRIVSWGGTDYEQGFARAAIRYQRKFGGTSLSVMPWGGWGRMDLKYVLEHTFDRPDLPQKIRLERHPVGLRADLRHDTHWGHVAGGLDVQGAYVRFERSEDLFNGSPTALVDDGTYVDTGVWLETRWRIDEGKLTLKPGVRFDYLGIAHASVIEPRVVATHELTSRLTLRESFGFHHQPPGPIAAIGTENGRGNILNPEDPRGNVVQGIHTSVGARMELPSSIVSSVTLYHARRRAPYDPTSADSWGSSVADTNSGFGLPFETGLGLMFDNVIAEELKGVREDVRRSFGAEVSVQRRTERFLAWISYTIATNEARRNGPSRYSWAPTGLDQTHNLNAVTSVRVGEWRLGARLRYSTGLPYTPRIGGTPDFMPIEGAHNSARLPAFVSVDLRADRTWHREWGAIAFFLDLQNVTNSDNFEGVDFDDEDGGPALTPTYKRGLPILPMIGISYEPPN
jgi:hypothetical protein